jgi:G3E family GTPase
MAHESNDTGDLRVPVILLAGALGSGRTRLIERVLQTPGFTQSAVLLNETGRTRLGGDAVFGVEGGRLGDAGAALREALVLSSGCICCVAGDALAVALDDLIVRSRIGQLPPFDRIIVEMASEADPVPVIEGLATSPLTRLACRFDALTCAIDARRSPQDLTDHPAWLAQIVCADRWILTHGDEVDVAQIATWHAFLAGLDASRRLGDARDGEALVAAFRDKGPGVSAGRVPLPNRLGPIERRGRLRPLAAAPMAGPDTGEPGGLGLPAARTIAFAGPSVWADALKTLEPTLSSPSIAAVRGLLRLERDADPVMVSLQHGRLVTGQSVRGALAPGSAGYLLLLPREPD